jgi:DNA-binding GntR family transcriptional regulator
MSTPKYEQVATAIREQIRSGQLKPGDRLPTGDQLQDQYDVGYGTLRTALVILTSEGWIEGRGGDGRFVSAKPPK